MTGVQCGMRERRQRLDELRAQVFERELTDEQRDRRVRLYLAIRARMPWAVIAWHDVWRALYGVSYSTPDHDREADAWACHLDRLGLDPAHRRRSCPLVRP